MLLVLLLSLLIFMEDLTSMISQESSISEGIKISVFEKNSVAGGRIHATRKDGFTFDLGPSWYLMPEVFEKFFQLFDKKIEDYLKLAPLDPMYKMFFSPPR